MSNDRLVTTHEMARKLACSQETVRRLARKEIIPCAKVGADYRFDPEKVTLALSRGVAK